MMQVPFVDLSAQYLSVQEEVDRAISRVLKRGWYILGEELEAFEKEFAKYCDVKFAVGVGSGTAAIHLSLVANGIREGDEVITVPNTAVPTVSAIVSSGARPVFVDIDPETFAMDPERLTEYLEKNKTKQTQAVLPVHLYGHPAEMESIMEIAVRYDLKVIEDACQAHGSEYRGKKAGSIGDAGCFSFYPTKNLGAYGDGGMIVTNNEKTAEQLRMLRNYGETEKNVNLLNGFNSRLDELQAAVLRVKLKYLDQWIEERRHYADSYANLLKGTDIITPVEKEYARHVFHLYVVRVTQRGRVQEQLKEKGIATGIHYPMPVHYQEVYKVLGYKQGDFPVAEKCAAEVLSLPMYPELKQEKIEYVCQVLKEI